jgi:1-deoxy-D-xylulose-5-phosphate reductoisomerase
MRTGGTAPAILNAANEVAVQAFLDGLISFHDIPATIRFALQQCSVHEASSLAVILADDAAARAAAGQCLATAGKAVTQ